jgi:hypothetical protein
VLVVRDLDRLARDAARQASLLVRLADAGVKVWSYADRSFVELEGYGYLLTAVKGVVAEQERAKAAQRIREVDGAKRWQLAGQISAGFLMHHVVKEASDSLTTWCLYQEPTELLAIA